MNYSEFLNRKSQLGTFDGFKSIWMPDFLFDFQASLVDWAVNKGKAGIFADCGLGKTPMQLVWAENIVRKTNKHVLVLTPLAVGPQSAREAEKFGIEAERYSGPNYSRKIVIANYEKLHLFSPNDFVGVVCDESSILKHFGGATQKAVTRFMSKLKYRLLCTATAAPNDFHELGTSSEALGFLGYSDMLSRFFKMDDKKRCRMNDVKLARAANSNHYAKLAYRVSQQIGAWRLKGHAEEPFWRWIASWARACRKPSDLGFADDNFILPELIERDHIVEPKRPADGMLFTVPAFGLKEEREERKRTLEERCDLVCSLISHSQPVVIWCHTNAEGDLLERMIPDCAQIAGRTPDEEKERIYEEFASGTLKRLVIKPKIGAWGLNWQHCNHVVTFASHSFEQYYQSVRRCWRFGQKRPVTVDVIASKGEAHVLDNMRRKSEAADRMFSALILHMNNALHLKRQEHTNSVEVPTWVA